MKKWLRLSWRQERIFQHRPVWAKVMKGCLLGAFVAGIFMANLMGRDAVSNAGILNDYFIGKFQYGKVNGEDLFFYILGERMPLLLLLLPLLFTSVGLPCGILALSWQGFSVGFMLAAGIAKYGVKGMALVLAGLFPQYLLYFPAYFFACCFAALWRQRMHGEGALRGKERKCFYGAGALAAAALSAAYLAGIVLESYVNPAILKSVLRFF